MTKHGWTLIHSSNGEAVRVGEIVISFRGDERIVEGGMPPHKPSSSGKVWVNGMEMYPEVFGLKWVETKKSA